MKNKIIKELKKIAYSTIGIIILGSAINLISWKFHLISSGLPGYALIANYLTGFSVGSFLFITNSIILGLSFLIVGKTAGLRGVYGYAMLSVYIDYSRNLFNLQQIAINSLSTNIFLIILQGIIAPIGIAIVMANGYSFGSYSSMMPIVNKFSDINAPKFFFIADFILSLITFYFFGIQSALLLLLNAAVFFLVFKSALKFINNYFLQK